MVLWERPAGEGCLPWWLVPEEAGARPEEGAGEAEEASCPQEEVEEEAEAGPCRRRMARTEEARGRRGARGGGEGPQERQLPVSEEGREM